MTRVQFFQHNCVSLDVNFNESLTNNIVSSLKGNLTLLKKALISQNVEI